jgi:tetratricopeptide (TPR) repeat protein
LGRLEPPEETLRKALEYELKALALDESVAMTHNLLGGVYASIGQLDRGIAEHAKARALNPNDPNIKAESAAYLPYAGRVDEAIELITAAMRLNPFTRTGICGTPPSRTTQRASTMPSSMRSSGCKSRPSIPCCSWQQVMPSSAA